MLIRPVMWPVAHTYIKEAGAPQAQCSWRITFDKISIRLLKAPIESHHIRAISTIVETSVILSNCMFWTSQIFSDQKSTASFLRRTKWRLKARYMNWKLVFSSILFTSSPWLRKNTFYPTGKALADCRRDPSRPCWHWTCPWTLHQPRWFIWSIWSICAFCWERGVGAKCS